MKRTTIFLIVLAVITVLPLSAQSEGSWGPIIEEPLETQTTTIGIYYHLSETLALHPFVAISIYSEKDKNEVADTVDEDGWFGITPGLGFDYTFVQNGPVSGFLGASLAIGYFSQTQEPAGGGETKDTTFGLILKPQMGARYRFTNYFSVFGKLTLPMVYESDKNKVTNAAGTVTAESKVTSFNIATVEPSLGVIFYLK